MLPGVGVCGTDIRILVPILREYGFSVEALWGKLQEAEALAEDLKIPYFSNKMGTSILITFTVLYSPTNLIFFQMTCYSGKTLIWSSLRVPRISTLK